jgi:hypothetical protein
MNHLVQRENLNATGDNSDAIRADNTSNLPVADQLPLKTNVKYSKYLYKEDYNTRICVFFQCSKCTPDTSGDCLFGAVISSR